MTFRVEIDGQLCFESELVDIPPGYKVGISAASAENPDSFEVFKMVVMSEHVSPSDDHQHAHDGGQQQQQPVDGGFFGNNEAKDPPAAGGNTAKWETTFEEDVPDAAASTFVDSASQFADLHNRILNVNHHLSYIVKNIEHQATAVEKNHAEIATQINDLKVALLSKLDKIDSMETKINNLETEIKRMKGDFSSKVSSAERAIKGVVEEKHEKLHDAVKEHASPGHGRLIFIIVGSQLVLVAGYIVYKKKKSSPKKYL